MKQIKFLIYIIALSLITGCNAYETDNLKESPCFTETSEGNIHNIGLVAADGEWIYYSNHNDNDTLYKMKRDRSDITPLSHGHFAYNLNFVNGTVYYTAGLPGLIYKYDTVKKRDFVVVFEKAENLIVTNKNIFYRLSSYNDDWGKLYKTDLKGRHKTLLAESVTEFAVNKGYIYYSDRNDNSFLYKMDINGNNITKLNDSSSSDINVEGEYVYYTDCLDNQKLYKMKTDGTDKALLSDDMCWNVNVSGGYIYYRNQTDFGKIYKMKTDGSENNCIINMENCTHINIIDDYLFFYVPSFEQGGYYMSDVNGNGITGY